MLDLRLWTLFFFWCLCPLPPGMVPPGFLFWSSRICANSSERSCLLAAWPGLLVMRHPTLPLPPPSSSPSVKSSMSVVCRRFRLVAVQPDVITLIITFIYTKWVQSLKQADLPTFPPELIDFCPSLNTINLNSAFGKKGH